MSRAVALISMTVALFASPGAVDPPTRSGLGDPVGPLRGPADAVELRIRSDDFDRFSDRLSLTNEERSAVRAVFVQYADSIGELDAEVNAHLIEFVGASSLEEAVSGLIDAKTRVGREKSIRYFLERQDRIKRVRARSDALRATFLEDAKAVVQEVRLSAWDDAVLALRRDVHMNPYQEPTGNSYEDGALRHDVHGRYAVIGSPLAEDNKTRCFNGRESFEYWRESTGMIAISILPALPMADHHAQERLFNMVDGRYPASHATLSSLVRRGIVKQHRIDASGRLVHSFSVEESPETLCTLILTNDVPRRLAEAIIETSVTTPRVYTNVTRFVVDEWTTLNDRPIPAKAHLEAKAFNRQEFPDQWIRTVTYYERLSLEPLTTPFDASMIAIPYATGTPVFDHRLNLSFEVGQKTLFLDGVIYPLEDPIMAHPGDRLPELLEFSRSGRAPTEPIATTALTAAPSKMSGLAIVAALVASIVVGVGVLVILAHRRRVMS